MKVVDARRLLDIPPIEYVNRLRSDVKVKYADGVVVKHTAHELTLNRFVYGLLELFPEFPIKSSYSVHNYYTAGQYVSSTINKSFEAILRDIVATHTDSNWDRGILEPVYERMEDIFESIYNDLIYNNLKYVTTLNIKDFLAIQTKPALLESIQRVRVDRDLESVENTYAVLDEIMHNDPDLRNNPIARGYVAGTLSVNQVKQLLASRGYVTEIDSSIFKYPIATGFVLGMENMYDLAVESRSGAKALYLSSRVIALAEYFAREMQLVTMTITSLIDGDCGNKDYIEWTVREDYYEGTELKSEFKNLIGAHYFEDGNEYVITAKDRHLIGKTIKLRNIMRCKLHNEAHVCTGCFGGLSSNVPKHANLGHLALVIMTAVISQLILSTKHITKSASSDSVVLDDATRAYFIIRNKDTYVFRANTINKKRYSYAVCIPQDQGFGLSTIAASADIRKLNLSRVSKLEMITLTKTDQNGVVEEIPISVKQGNRSGRFTYEFLEHLKQYGCTLDDQDRLVIGLDNWKTGVPFITLPQVEFSYIDLANAIKAEFKYMKTDPGTPEAFLHKIYNIVNSKLSVNIALLEVIVMAFIAKDPDNGDYSTGRNSPTAKPAKLGDILTSRSLGGAYAWERGINTLLSPVGYYGNNAIDHPLDVLVRPNETLMKEFGRL